ncbi:MAG TPA: PKD domain-containing protein, partial [Flavisolibacter sp.]|nr:PKD domain-containing protein [Flavisolibacter sp.]
SPSSVYDKEGLYTVSLTITDANGCTDSVAKTGFVSIHVPVASYTVSDSASSCTPLQVQFTNTSKHYEQQSWELNGGVSKLPNPVQSYNTPGVYQTKLIVTAHGGCTDTATKTIRIYDAAAAKISYLPLGGCKPLTVNVTAYSQQKMTYIWDFGDGSIVNSNEPNYTHIYNAFGNFVPKIIMKDSQGCIIPITGLDTIRIKGATAKFGADRTFFCDSGTVSFSDSTSFNNPIESYRWDFGDGTSSTLPSPSHHFANPGIYPVSLSVKTQNQCVDTFRLVNPVKVVASPAVRIAGDSVICVGEAITHLGVFERADTSLVKWTWKFPNGKRSTAQMPPRQFYNEIGRHMVQAIAENSSGCMDTAFRPIRVNPIPTVKLPSTITTMIGTPVLLPAVYSDTMRLYKWSVPDGLNCTTCPQPMAQPRFNTKYYVQFEDFNGCRNSGEVQVIVLCNNDNIFVPNTFSPNGDGSNDVFYVRGKGLSRVKSLRIFNRWGQVVFER